MFDFITRPLVQALGVGVVILALIATIMYYRGSAIQSSAKLESANERLNRAVQVNQEQRVALQRALEARQRNDELASDLARVTSELYRLATVTRDNINTLERNNAQVRDYLSTAIPSQLRCLLNGGTEASCANGDGKGTPATSAPNTVPQSNKPR